MTPVLRRFTAREEKFLYLVAQHSGVFTMAQFCASADIQPGAASLRFGDKCLGRDVKAASVAMWRCGPRPTIYRLSKDLHDQLGRGYGTVPRRDLDIRTRLMCLDFVVSNPSFQFLHSHDEKEAYVSGRCSVSPPARTFVVGAEKQTVTHAFPENFPVFLDGDVVCFAAVNVNAGSFRRFIRSHREILRALKPSRLVFVSSSESKMKFAKSTFAGAMCGHEIAEEELIERDRLEEIPTKDLEFDQAARLSELRSKLSRVSSSDVEFSGFILDSDYDFFERSTPRNESPSASASLGWG